MQARLSQFGEHYQLRLKRPRLESYLDTFSPNWKIKIRDTYLPITISVLKLITCSINQPRKCFLEKSGLRNADQLLVLNLLNSAPESVKFY